MKGKSVLQCEFKLKLQLATETLHLKGYMLTVNVTYCFTATYFSL